MVRRQIELVLSRARYAAIGAAIGGGLGGLFSRNAASSGAAIGALVGAAVGENRLTAQSRIDDLRERRGELFSNDETNAE
jgi:osmotically inducible lipoprotein OsmB